MVLAASVVVLVTSAVAVVWLVKLISVRNSQSGENLAGGTADDVGRALNQIDAMRGASSPERNEPWDGVDRLKAMDNNGGL